MNLNEQVRILSIFHYVVGAMHAFFGCFGLIHLSIGLMFIFNPQAFGTAAQNGPPAWFGLIFVAAGGAVVLFGWTLGILTILSGRFISRRVHWTFSLVMGGINCALFPFGTVLGVFDLILLTKEEIKMQYPRPEEQSVPPVPQNGI